MTTAKVAALTPRQPESGVEIAEQSRGEPFASGADDRVHGVTGARRAGAAGHPRWQRLRIEEIVRQGVRVGQVALDLAPRVFV